MPRKKPTTPAETLPFEPAAAPAAPVPARVVDLTSADADAVLLAAAAHVERAFTVSTDPWHGSPFNWLKQLPTASRSKAAESIVATTLAAAGFRVAARSAGGAAIAVEDRPVQVKFSTLWSSGAYVFQQLAPVRTPHFVLLGVSPSLAHAWVVPAAAVEACTDANWLQVDPNNPPPLLGGRGGPVAAFLAAALDAFGLPSSLPSGLPASWAAPVAAPATVPPARRARPTRRSR